jgi:tetratricopeptide (TPR) repeat protein
VNDPTDVAWYVLLLKGETPSPFGGSVQPDLTFLRDFGDVETLGKFAGAWLKENISPKNPLWIDAEVAWLRYIAESDPRRALDELHKLSPETQRDCAAWLDPLELDLLVFYRRDAGAEDRIRQIALRNIGTPIEKLADVRLGDLYRLLGKYKEASAQYLSIQKTVLDESESRKLPAQDRAFSITINDFIESGHREAAESKLQEWEFRHPMAKLDTDFLLLRARTWMLFGRWQEALSEIDSFEKMQTDSPYEIDAEFYRARVLYETGQKDAARKIWTQLARDYPKNELAQKSMQWAAKP